MQGDDETVGGESAAARARDPGPQGEPDAHQLGAPTPADALCGMDAHHSQEARRLQESIRRRMADKRTVQLLSEEGFEGPRYARFEEELVRYASSVLKGWMHSGYVFKLVAKRGFNLNPNEWELEELVCDSDLRQELADMTVALALPRFRQRALVEGGWRHEGGASITTYFMGACVYEFPNEYRRHRTDERRWRLGRERDEATTAEAMTKTPSSETETVGKLGVLEDLRDIDSLRERAVVALTIDPNGYTQEEIREIVGAESVKAVEGLLYRWRKKAKRDEEGEWHE